jgi:hypothetical protein
MSERTVMMAFSIRHRHHHSADQKEKKRSGNEKKFKGMNEKKFSNANGHQSLPFVLELIKSQILISVWAGGPGD